MTVGERIKKLRIERGISQVELADKINVSKQTLYKYENDIITNIPSDKIENIAAFFNTTPSYLMGWDEDVNDIRNRGVSDLISILSPQDYKEIYEKYGYSYNYINDMFSPQNKYVNASVISKIALALDVDIVDAISAEKMHPGDFTKLLSIYDDIKYGEIKILYDSLNDIGKEKAKEELTDLASHPKYKKNSLDLEVNAARERTDIEITEEMKQHDENIMDDENF